MNSSPESPARQTPGKSGRWLLEIVRGRDVGRTFALDPGETVVGNALNGQTRARPAEQEGSSPRRMAARHASVECSGQRSSIRDLESPGGTFVNQQRLLSGQARKLSAGRRDSTGRRAAQGETGRRGDASRGSSDRAGAASPARRRPACSAPSHQRPDSRLRRPAPASPAPAARHRRPLPSPASGGGRLPTPFAMASGAQCRTWDDFLVLSAQSWAQVRDELVSGRLVDYLRRIGRPDLIPHSAPDRSPDDRLDEWLARLPATQSSAPELDVHPETLLVQAKMGGGVARLSLRITNVGFRLLRSTVRIEPADARWVKLLAGQDGRPFQTIDQTEIPVEVELPETIERLLRAFIVDREQRRHAAGRGSNRAAGRAAAGGPAPARGRRFPRFRSWQSNCARRLATVSPLVPVPACCGVAQLGIRLLFALVNALPLGGAGKSLAEPRISSVALITVAVGVLWRD